MLNRRITACFDDSIAKLLHDLTGGNSLSMSRLIRTAVYEYFKKHGWM